MLDQEHMQGERAHGRPSEPELAALVKADEKEERENGKLGDVVGCGHANEPHHHRNKEARGPTVLMGLCTRTLRASRGHVKGE